MFTDKRWQALDAPDVRYVMPWDAIKRNGWELAVLDNYMYWARQDEAREVLLSFGHSQPPRPGAQDAEPRSSSSASSASSAAATPRSGPFQAWNEGNHGTQPTFTKPGPRRAATTTRCAAPARSARSRRPRCSTRRT